MADLHAVVGRLLAAQYTVDAARKAAAEVLGFEPDRLDDRRGVVWGLVEVGRKRIPITVLVVEGQPLGLSLICRTHAGQGLFLADGGWRGRCPVYVLDEALRDDALAATWYREAHKGMVALVGGASRGCP